MANVKPRMVTVNGVRVLVCETMTEIPKGRLLTLCYGPQYWMSLGIVPQLFTPNGRVASPQGYIYNEISVMVRFTQADGQIGQRVFKLNSKELVNYFKVTRHYIMRFSPDQPLASIDLDEKSVATAMQKQSPFVSLLDPRVILGERSELKKNYDVAEALHVLCGIFSQSIKTSKKEQLRRISSALLPKIEWKYDARKSCAFLQSDDKEKLDLIADHLKENRVGDVSVSKLRDSNSYILTVKDLNVSQLLDTPAEIGKKLR